MHARYLRLIMVSVGLLAAGCTAQPAAIPATASTTNDTTADITVGQPSSIETTPPTTEEEVRLPPLDEPYLIVDNSGGSGGSGTIDDPIGRPREALDLAGPGTTVYYLEGVYSDAEVGNNLISASGRPEAWIRLTPFPDHSVLIDAGGEWGNGFEIVGGSYIQIDGFTIVGRLDSIHGSGVFAKEGSAHIRILENNISGFGGAGVSTVRSSAIEIRRNIVDNNSNRSSFQGSGISIFEAEGPLASDGYTNFIGENLVRRNSNEVLSPTGLKTDGNCIIIDFFNATAYEGSTLVENNVCVENGGRGIHVFNSSNVVARNNTLFNNVRSGDLNGGKAELVAARGDNISFYNNVVVNSDGVLPFVISDATTVVFEGNFFAQGELPPGVTNQLLPIGPTFISDEPFDLVDFYPRNPVGPTVTQPTFAFPASDAAGEERPVTPSAGALEPRSS